MKVVRRLASMERAELALLVRTSLLLVRMRVALWLLPWRRVLALLPPEAARANPVGIDRLERAVRVASRVVPRATCLTQALALNHLLSRNGYTSIVRIGVAKEDGRFAAHAWVECGGRPLLSSAADVARYAPLVAWTPAHPDAFR
jgi:hypothetical protein